MPLRMPLTPTRASSALLRSRNIAEAPSLCSFASLSVSRLSRPTPPPRCPNLKLLAAARRPESTTASPSPTRPDARKELENALAQLHKHAANHVNISRVQLALNGLRQTPGNESIRVAVLGLNNGAGSGRTAKEVLKLLLADPLKSPEPWEQEVDDHDLAQPMIVRVGAEDQQQPAALSMARRNVLHEVNVSSPTLNGHNLELLLIGTNLPASVPGGGAVGGFEDSVLVPTVDIPISNTGKYTPFTTPVHKALIVADGIMGAASVASLPVLEREGAVAAAVDLPEYTPVEQTPLPFIPVDVNTAATGLDLIRREISNAMAYEQLWFRSNVPKLVEWLKADILETPDNTTKPPLRRLVASLLQSAASSIQREEARQLSAPLVAATSAASVGHLKVALADWAEGAHTELQDQLDIAFSSRRWRKLGWWKLFWRVDDVSMLSTEMLSQRFLPTAERSAIFLAGRMEEAGVPMSSSTNYMGHEDGAGPSSSLALSAPTSPRWPTNIPIARAYLQNETIPALQALAQSLVFQTLSTSGLTTSLGALVYFGTLTTGVYEAGAVAALGIVWSLRGMQKRWEAAREYWEGEVREEGRKAVRGVEVMVGKVLEQKQAGQGGARELDDELQKAKEALEKAADALERLK